MFAVNQTVTKSRWGCGGRRATRSWGWGRRDACYTEENISDFKSGNFCFHYEIPLLNLGLVKLGPYIAREVQSTKLCSRNCYDKMKEVCIYHQRVHACVVFIWILSLDKSILTVKIQQSYILLFSQSLAWYS